MNRLRHFAKKEDGAVMVIAAFGLVALLSIVSLVTDMGLKYHQKSVLQSAMDAAALAAVRYMPDEQTAKQVALEYVEKNGFTTESVVIEFPSSEIVRVSDSRQGKTIFASLFKVDSVQINAKAAAKFVNKNMAIDFEYLMFHGDNTQFTLGGHYNLGGSIFGNGNVHADGSGSTVSGTVFSANNASYNQYSVNNQAVFSLIGNIQEETHRFAITYHRSLRSKRLRYSELDGIPGIGPKRKQELLKQFKSLTAIGQATLPELERLLPKDAAAAVYHHFRKKREEQEELE